MVLAAVALVLTGTVMVPYLLAAVAARLIPRRGRTRPGLAVDRPLLAGAALLIVGSLTAVLAARLRLPAALLFLAVGMVVGDDGWTGSACRIRCWSKASVSARW